MASPSGAETAPASSNPFAGLVLDDSVDTDGFARPRKRRSIAASESVVPDLEAASLKDGLRFVALVDIGSLDPCWGRGLEANRSLMEKHVDALTTHIRQSDRRFDVINRCQASAADSVIEALMKSVPADKRHLLKNFDARSPTDLAIIDVSGSVIKLESGQHRRAAVMKINGLAVQATTGVFRDSGLDKTNMSAMWPVEFYSAEFLTDHPLSLVRLRCNIDTAKQKNSFGDDMAIVHRSWNVITTEARRAILSSQKSFVDFLNGILPSNTSVTTWLPLLKHGGWQEWIQTITSFPWGRATLVASQLTTAFACHHPKPSFDLFASVMRWFREHFKDVCQIIDAEDMAYLIAKSKIFTTLTPRPLFFPVWPDDFASTTAKSVASCVASTSLA
ncbi:hypothetical protein ZTR_00010 [Talaromyces verruculosus]|nr:hypothetical protein ZTR_00010 [Talaromyces verruculosus]